MKRMKLLLLLSIIVLAFVLSCTRSGEDSVSQSKESKTSMLFKSKEYNNLNGELIDLGKAIKKNYSVLSNEDRHKVMLLVDSVNNSELGDKEALAKELFLILNIDADAFTRKIEGDVASVRKYISKNEINVADIKIGSMRNAKIQAVKSTRELSEYECVLGCAAVAGVCGLACTPVALTGCYALCLSFYAACCLLC